jgi:hypothetical protein
MSFFDSEIVRAEMVGISELQEEVYSSAMNFAFMNNRDKLHHIELLEKLLNKQKVLYARLSLSDDPEAKLMKQNIADSALMMGLPRDVDITTVFDQMNQMIGIMKMQIDKDQSAQ